MKTLRPLLALFTLAIPGSFASGTGCRTPTDMTVHVLTDVPCTRQRGAVVIAATPGEYESAPPSGRSQSCTQVGPSLYDLGTMVLVPHKDGDDRIGIRVVLGLSKDAESCAVSDKYDGCVVARRLLHYLPHDELTVEVLLREDCANIPCSADSTCIGHGCKSAEVNPRACAPHCDETAVGGKCSPPGSITCSGGTRLTCRSDGAFDSESCGLACDTGRCIRATGIASLGSSAVKGASCILAGGDVYCFGANDQGQLGLPLTMEPHVPTKVPGLPKIQQISSSPTATHLVALDIDGSVWCWGSNESAECGEPATGVAEPRRITALSGVAQVAASSISTCARVASGAVLCFGANSDGELGRGGTGTHDGNPAPVLTAGWSGKAIDVACTGNTCCVLDDAHKVACFGHNADGQVGSGTIGGEIGTPSPVSLPAGARAIASGDNVFCAVLDDGRVACWGNANFGVFVTATTAQSTPMIIPGLAGVVGVAIGAPPGHYAWTASGTTFGWGSDGLVKGPPAPVTALGGATQITLTWEHACAIIAGGVSCWGDNASGGLGDGTVTPHAMPAPVKSPF